jgi:UDP-2,3-diacylglucosamine pyrophosphatase LpxH
MGVRTKRIFISDIHLGDSRSMEEPHPYSWFKKNIGVLGHFLEEQLNAPDVKEVIILGDLFDTWVIPVDENPLTVLDAICSNAANTPVIDMLKALAASPDVKLAYVPGNHDMSMNSPGISATKQFVEATFPGICYCCDNSPCGVYRVGCLAAEHGNRFCLFNAPYISTHSNAFLPLGYFISRIVAHKVKTEGFDEDPRQIFINLLKHFIDHKDFVEVLLLAIAGDAKLTSNDPILMTGVPGYQPSITIGEIGRRFRNLIRDWDQAFEHFHIPSASATLGDIGELWWAVSGSYFRFDPQTKICICGHTHNPVLAPLRDDEPQGEIVIATETPCRAIYANCGTWVDKAKNGCTYVETQEVATHRRHYVRVKKYPGNEIFDGNEGFIEM